MKTANDKAAALKMRKDQERALGAQIDRLMSQADVEPSGCGMPFCGLWRRLTGRQRTVVIAAAVDATAAQGTAVSTGAQQSSSRLFGIKKADPHAKLAEAAATMEQRNQQLESRAASEREEAKRQMALGQKSSAMRALKKAKMTEKQLEANAAALMAVEQQMDLMAQAQMQKQVASALASSSKGMKAQKQLLKNAESAVDDASEARDMADDLGQVMTEFASNGNGDADDDELMDELQSMMDADPPPPPAAAMQDVPLSSDNDLSLVEAAGQAEMARLESRHVQWEEAEAVRQTMPSAPKANGKAKMSQKQLEKEHLLSVGSGQA